MKRRSFIKSVAGTLGLAALPKAVESKHTPCSSSRDVDQFADPVMKFTVGVGEAYCIVWCDAVGQTHQATSNDGVVWTELPLESDPLTFCNLLALIAMCLLKQ